MIVDKWRQTGNAHGTELDPEPQCYVWRCRCGDSARYYTLDECMDGAREHCLTCRKWWTSDWTFC